MKFSKTVANIARTNDLRRIAKSRLIDVTRLNEEELRQALAENWKLFSDCEEIKERLERAIFHRDPEVRIIAPILLVEIFLQQSDLSLPQTETESLVLDWEQEVIDESNKQESQTARKIYNFDFFVFVLEAAWENDNEISPDEKRLIERIRGKLKISTREYRLAEAQLGKFPKDRNELHSREDVNRVRIVLQELGLLLTYRDSEGTDYDIIPEEMEKGFRLFFGFEIRRHGYRKLISHRFVRNKSYLESCLSKAEVALARSTTVAELQEICVEHIPPTLLLGGLTARDGLEKGQLENWCRELNQQTSGTKSELIERVIAHYDGLIETTLNPSDERAPWFEHFEEFAARNYGFLRAQELIEKDQDVDKRFEYATDYLFEVYLGHKPLNLPGSEQPDGALSLGDSLLLWDNKSKEKECELKIHLPQFQRYFSKAEKRVVALMVVAPAFTPESEQQAKLYQIETGNQISLITASELKAVALLWKSSKKASDPFPLKYFTTTGRFESSLIPALIA